MGRTPRPAPVADPEEDVLSAMPPAPVVDPVLTDPDPRPPTRRERRVLRVLVAVLTPVVAGALTVGAFQWIRTTEAGRGFVVLVAIAVGIGGVLALFVGTGPPRRPPPTPAP